MLGKDGKELPNSIFSHFYQLSVRSCNQFSIKFFTSLQGRSSLGQSFHVGFGRVSRFYPQTVAWQQLNM